MAEPDPGWHVYIVRCADNSLYTGIARNLEERLAAHNAGKGARYTRGRGPVTLLWSEPAPDRATASRREYDIKQLSRTQKEALTQSAN